MILSSIPEIVALLVLLSILWVLARRRPGDSVHLWLRGMLFILLEEIAFGVLRGSPGLRRSMHALALDAYVAAAVTFAWSSRQDRVPEQRQLPLFLIPACPMLIVTTIYGLGLEPRALYVVVTSAALVLGLGYLVLPPRRFQDSRLLIMVGICIALWAPSLVMAIREHIRGLVYWDLCCAYLLVGFSFRRKVRRGRVGGVVVVAGFVVWALCFLVHPLVPPAETPVGMLAGRIWSMQKYFVVIGMLLLLLEEQTDRSERDALRDPLTGLPNRRLLEDRLAQALERARRYRTPGALFLVDLDGFKAINDQLGHRQGDRILQQAAHLLHSRVRTVDTVARCGGDEFHVLVIGVEEAAALETVSQALRDAVSRAELPENCGLELSASVGYARFPEEAMDSARLQDLADGRMYEQKRNRRVPAAAR